jgi:hypothetical protein
MATLPDDFLLILRDDFFSMYLYTLPDMIGDTLGLGRGRFLVRVATGVWTMSERRHVSKRRRHLIFLSLAAFQRVSHDMGVYECMYEAARWARTGSCAG